METQETQPAQVPDLIPLVMAHREAVRAHQAAQAAAVEALRTLEETGKEQQIRWDAVDEKITAMVDVTGQLRRDWRQTERK